jgi:hypothetical protein
MIRLTRVLTLTLALLVAMTSQQMAMARGMTKDAADQVVLCTEAGPVTVTLDAQGNPIGPVHICPDCALYFVGLMADTPTTPPAVVHIQTLDQTSVVAPQTTVIPNCATARGPPVFV